MTSKALTASVATAFLLCAALAGPNAEAAAYRKPAPASAAQQLYSGLTHSEAKALRERSFQGIPIYPGSVIDPDLAAYMPSSFAILAYSAGNASPYRVARYYVKSMTTLGWTLVESTGLGETSESTSDTVSLTFGKQERVLTVDMTRTRRGRLRYSLFTYTT